MQTTSLFRRAAALALTLVLAVSASLAGFATYDMPIQTVSDTESVYLFNLDTGKPILDQNAGQSRYIASLTKMMTALLFLESGKDLNEEITIPTSLTQEFKDIQNANGSTMNLRIGETVRRIDLLYGLLVASANDAASVIASDVSGGNLPAFVSMMNQKAQELGCTGTSFTCVHGLYDYGNVSTAEDLAKIASACYANETYMQVANTQSYTLPATNLHQNERAITSTNLMLNPEYAYYRDYIRGMKTGFTTLAGRCFVTFAEKDGHTYGLVVLGSDLDNIYRECAEILDWAFASFSDRQLTDTQTVLTTVPLTKCRSEEAVELYAAEPVSGYGHADDHLFVRGAGKRLRHRERQRRHWQCHRLSGRLRDRHRGPRDPSGIYLGLSHRPQNHAGASGGPHPHLSRPQLRHHGHGWRLAEPQPPPQDPQKIISLIQQKLPRKNAAAFLIFQSVRNFAASTDSVILGLTCVDRCQMAVSANPRALRAVSPCTGECLLPCTPAAAAARKSASRAVAPALSFSYPASSTAAA